MIPPPQLRIVFRSAMYGGLGLVFFLAFETTGHPGFWWVGLLLIYMSAQRLILNVGDQIADRIMFWAISKTAAFQRWNNEVHNLCASKGVPTPTDVVDIYNKGTSPYEAMRIAAKRHHFAQVR